MRITTLHSLTYTWLMPRLPDFAAKHPRIRLAFDTEAALTRFDEGGPDLGIRHGPGHWPGLTAHRLMDETLFPVASPRMPGIDAMRDAADIARLPLIADHARQGWHDWFRVADVHGARARRALQLQRHHRCAATPPRIGLGAALARERIVVPYLADGRLAALPGPRMAARWGYHIVYPSHRRLRPAAQAFVDWLLSVAAD